MSQHDDDWIDISAAVVASSPDAIIAADMNGTIIGWNPAAEEMLGFTADQAIFLVHVEDKQMVWTIQIRGLTGQSEILRSFDGTYHTLARLEEGHF